MDFLLKFSNIYPKSKVCIKTVQVFSNKLPLELRGCLHEISFRAKWNILISVSSQFLITVCIIKPEMKLPVGVISLQTFSQKWNFIWGDKVSCKRYPKWNHMKRNNCTYVNKNDWLLLNGPFTSDHPRKRHSIYFIHNEK